MELLTDPGAWIGLLTLTTLEIVLGIDNIVFISILSVKLPADQQARARRLGLLVAMGTRILLLLSLSWVLGLTRTLFTVPGVGEAGDISGRDLVLLLGGLVLIAKSTRELHERIEGEQASRRGRAAPTLVSVVAQIMVLDVVFSLDSVITAVGMVNELAVMIAAVVIAVLFMMAFAGAVSSFVEGHPTVKVLALAFLVLIGVNLIADGLGQHIPRGYTYFAMGFSMAVEAINLRVRARRESSGPESTAAA
ncbi:MAG: TerC family protein [Chthonomonadales bacterium]|nr:TerC family protein [Chthonomonadales bacterium]